MKQQNIASPPCEIRSFNSPSELARAVARDWLELLQIMSLAGREPSIAFSGGRIASLFFEEAVKVLRPQQELSQKAHYFWADERCVPPDDPESNFGLAANLYLRPLKVPESNIHRIPGEFGADLAASTAARGLFKWTGTDPEAVPSLNLVLLGMGEDGHVASLFPGEAEEIMDYPICFRGVNGPKPPSIRVTMSYQMLSRAEQVWVLVSGPGKAEALKGALIWSKSPLGRVLRSRSSTRIYTDLTPESSLSGPPGQT